jgi:hypothetical protein
MADVRNMEQIIEKKEKDYHEAKSIQKRILVPIWEKCNLTLEEAAAYSNIGINKLRSLSDAEGCEWALWIGNKRLIRRNAFLRFLDEHDSL